MFAVMPQANHILSHLTAGSPLSTVPVFYEIEVSKCDFEKQALPMKTENRLTAAPDVQPPLYIQMQHT